MRLCIARKSKYIRKNTISIIVLVLTASIAIEICFWLNLAGVKRERTFLLFIGDEKIPVRAVGYEFWEGKKPGEHIARNEILKLYIPPSIQEKLSKQEIKDLLIEAITESHHGLPNNRLKNLSVTINFANTCD